MPNDQQTEESPTDVERASISLDMYRENAGFVRHYEEIRFKFSQISIGLTAALIGLARLTTPPPDRSKLIAVFVICLAATLRSPGHSDVPQAMQ
jgi:hypothetical protein